MSTRLLYAISYFLLITFPFATSVADEKLKIGFVYNSPVGDAGWTYQHDQGRQAIEEALGDRVETHFVESVTETDVERVLRQLVNNGYKLIFTTSFGFMNPTIKVAESAPDVKFQHATGYKLSHNVGVYHARAYEARFLAGIVAGEMSKTNIAGFIASFPIPEVIRGINAFTMGMRSVNPETLAWIFHPFLRKRDFCVCMRGLNIKRR